MASCTAHAAVTSELLRLSHLPQCQLVDYPADLVARLRRMREAHGYSRIRMLVHIERCERARGLVAYASISIPPEGDIWGESVTAYACYSGHELLAIRIPGSDVWQLPTAYQAQAWADGRITIGAQL